MRATFTLPSGNTIRADTKRDLVLILEDSTGPWIERRSDSFGVITSLAGTIQRAGGQARMYLGDTTTGKIRVLP